jgi:hypothetical protein
MSSHHFAIGLAVLLLAFGARARGQNSPPSGPEDAIESIRRGLPVKDEYAAAELAVISDNVSRASTSKPWIPHAYRAGWGHLRAGGSPEEAKKIIYAVDRAGRRFAARVQRGGDVEERKSLEDIIKEELISTGVEVAGDVPYIGRAVTGIYNVHKKYRAEQERWIDDPTYYGELTNSAVASIHAGIDAEQTAQHMASLDILNNRLTPRELLESRDVTKIDARGVAVLTDYLTGNTEFRIPRERRVEVLVEDNPESGEKLQIGELADRTKDIDERIRAVERFLSERYRKAKEAWDKLNDKLDSQKKELDAIRVEEAATQKKIDALEKAIRARFNAEDEARRRALEAEKRRLAKARAQAAKEARDRQEFEETMWMLDSSAVFLDQIGRLSGDTKFQKIAAKGAGFLHVVKKGAELSTKTNLTGIGTAALTLNYASLGVELLGLAIGGSSPNYDALILQKLEELSREMHERFDRLEYMMGAMHAEMRDHFGAMHRALSDLRRESEDARARLQTLQEDMTKLSSSIRVWVLDIRTYGKAEQEILFKTEVQEFILRHPRHDAPRSLDEFSRGLARFTVHGRDRSSLPHLVGTRNTINKSASLSELTVAIREIIDAEVYASLDSVLWFDHRAFSLALPEEMATKQFPSLHFWANAADAYGELLAENLVRSRYHLNPKDDIRDLTEAGELIRRGLQLGRDKALFEKLLAQYRVERDDCFNLIEAECQFFWENNLGKLSSTPGGLEREFSLPQDQPARAERIKALEERFPPGLFKEQVKIRHGDKTLDTPEHFSRIVPPVLRAWSDVRSKLTTDGKTDWDFAIEAKLEEGPREVRKTFPKNKAGDYTARTVAPLNVRFSFSCDKLTGELFTGTLVGRAELVFSETNVIGGEPYGVPIKETPDQVQSWLLENWKARVNIWENMPGLWDPNPAPAVRGLSEDIGRLWDKFAKEVTFAATAPRSEVEKSNRFKYLRREKAIDLNTRFGEFAAMHELLIRHLLLFAPDYIQASGEQELKRNRPTADAPVRLPMLMVLEECPPELVLDQYTRKLLEDDRDGVWLNPLNSFGKARQASDVSVSGFEKKLLHHLEAKKGNPTPYLLVDGTIARLIATGNAQLRLNELLKDEAAFTRVVREAMAKPRN